MKVIFVYPKVSYYYDRTPYVPLGIAYLAASIRGIAVSIECIDGQILTGQEYEEAIYNINGDVVCISATLLQVREAIRIASLVKKRLPDATIIIGGYGPHSLPVTELFALTDFDFFVMGEGEITLRILLECLKGGGDVQKIPNIVFKARERIIANKNTLFLPDIDSLFFPDRNLFNIGEYFKRWKKNTGMTSLHMISSRGCPFGCTFCDKSITGRTYRVRKSRLVVDEMAEIQKTYCPDDLFLFDDLFTLDKTRVLEICQEIKSRRMNIKWSVQARVGTVDAELLFAMKTTGCTEVLFGVESGSNKILSFLRKGFTRTDAIRTFDICREVGISAGAYLIVGVPEETAEDIDLTIDLVKRIKPSILNFSFLTPFPNTPLYKKTSQWISEKNWSNWDDFTRSVYNARVFEIDPRIARQRIMEAYKKLIDEGLPHSPYQLLE